MTAAELEKLLAQATQGDWTQDNDRPYEVYAVDFDDANVTPAIGCVFTDNTLSDLTWMADAALFAAAPKLARRVIAADNLAEALRGWQSSFDTAGLVEHDHPQADQAECWRDGYAALAAWEAAQ